VPKKKRLEKTGPKEKMTTAQRVVEALRKAHGEDAAGTLGNGGISRVKEVLPFGLDVLDRRVLGIGGLPYGRVTEVSGPESAGKTSLVNHLIARAQRDGALATLGDSERKVSPDWCDVFGVNRADVVVLPARTIEEYLDHVGTMLSKFPRVKQAHFLDSVATTDSRKVFEQDLEEKEIPGVNAAAWSRGLRRYVKELSEHPAGALMVLVNQVRSKIGVLYGPKENTTGGRAIPYYSTIRLAVFHGKTLKDGEENRVAKWVGVRAMKNHCAVSGNYASVLLRFRTGFDDDASTVEHAHEMKITDPKDRDPVEARRCLGWAKESENKEESDGPGR
jgi:recombination protein RecA